MEKVENDIAEFYYPCVMDRKACRRSVCLNGVKYCRMGGADGARSVTLPVAKVNASDCTRLRLLDQDSWNC